MKLNPKRLMPPPWLACPEIERYSIGWRMGYGEDYLDRFGVWLESLSTEEQMEYRTLFPEPVTWRGWWEDDETGELVFLPIPRRQEIHCSGRGKTFWDLP